MEDGTSGLHQSRSWLMEEQTLLLDFCSSSSSTPGSAPPACLAALVPDLQNLASSAAAAAQSRWSGVSTPRGAALLARYGAAHHAQLVGSGVNQNLLLLVWETRLKPEAAPEQTRWCELFSVSQS